MKKISVFACFLLLTVIQVNVSNAASSGKNKNAIASANKFIKVDESQKISAENAIEWLKNKLECNPQTSFKEYQRETDELGYTHIRLREYYKGIEVENGVYYLHCKNNYLQSANGEFYSIQQDVSSAPLISKENAKQKVIDFENSNKIKSISNPTLVYSFHLGEIYLSYKFNFYSIAPLKRELVFVNATNSSIIKSVSILSDVAKASTANSLFSGNVNIISDSISPTNFKLRDKTRGNGIYVLDNSNGDIDFTNTTRNWNATNTVGRGVYDVMYGLEKTYDFYWSKFSRNSFGNVGDSILGLAHNSIGVNAYWDGVAFNFGDGDNIDYYPVTSLEIVGHEFTHAVTEKTAALIYSNESGALNESFSDIFGNTIRFTYTPANANWYNGDQLVISGGTGHAFRSMSNPKLFSNPDCYGGTYWAASNDVHYNSGVQNHWYYLLAIGGTGTNDLGNIYSVQGIGLTDAIKIAYRNLTHYLTPNSTYADARTYSIQSAVDLYGACSNQVIQVTNAWHAVGVGAKFSNAIVSNFTTPSNIFCKTPASVSFQNYSVNGTTFAWSFGDGGTSTLSSPTHSYATAGTFTARLIANGSTACNTKDTFFQTITVSASGGPANATCSPSTVTSSSSLGIFNVKFKSINSSSLASFEGYKDFTCTKNTTVTRGDQVMINVTTGSSTHENVKAWIDYNNDGAFNNTNELVLNSVAKLINHSGLIHIPTSATIATPLRMRVISDSSTYSISSACSNSNYGQAEDYTVNITSATNAPVANFYASDSTVLVGNTINFYDLSSGGATSWSWTFQGATPSVSTIQNPTNISYTTPGNYTVTLIATNSYGSDTLIKTMYIHAINSVNMCSGTTVLTSAQGIIYDSGGPSGIYSNSENCTMLISPPCADTITLTIVNLNSESGADYLRIYDGTSTAGVFIGNYSGNYSNSILKATSGSMFISWHSDGSINYSGYQLNFNTKQFSTLPPVAAFNISNANPAYNSAVQFNDASTNLPDTWHWDFGDGNISTLQNPTHNYVTSGTKTVTLIAFTCNHSDTISHTLNVQAKPQYTYHPSTINVSTINCNDSIIVPVTIKNTGTSDLFVDKISGAQNGVSKKIVAYMFGVDSLQEYLNTINAIQQSYSSFTLTTVNTISASVFQAALVNKDILLFPEQENGISNIYTPFASAVQSFLNNGGTVIFCGTTNATQRQVDLGVLNCTYQGYVNSGNLTVNTPGDSLLSGTSSPYSAQNLSVNLNYSADPNYVSVLNYSGGNFSEVGHKKYGNGMVYFIGFDFYSSDVNTNKFIANAVKQAATSNIPNWMHISPTQDTLLSAGDSVIIYIKLSAKNLAAGNYTSNFLFSVNDSLHSKITIPVNFHVHGTPSISLSKNCLAFGNVYQSVYKYDTVLINNSGCDTLFINAHNFNGTKFSIANNSLKPYVLAYSTDTMVVSFYSTTIGNYTDTLYLQANTGTQKICLSAHAKPAPHLTVISPSSIHVNLASCGDDSIKVKVVIKNTGGDTLFVNNSPTPYDTLKVLALTYGADTTIRFPNAIAALNTQFTKYNLTTINTTSGNQLASALVGKDIFILPTVTNGVNSIFANYASALQNYVNNGGIALVLGNYYSSQMQSIVNTGLITGNMYGSAGYTDLVVNASHPIMMNIPSQFYPGYYTCALNISNTNTNKLATVNGNSADVITLIPKGQGYVVYLGFDYYSTYPVSQQLIGNVFKWIHQNNVSSWTPNGVQAVVPSAKDTIYITLNNSGLQGGSYNGNAVIHSNDPTNPKYKIPYTISVDSMPCVKFGSIGSQCNGTVQFNDSSTNYVSIWSWNFGDGGFDIIQNPTHNYTAAGNYLVTLVGCNSNGVCDTATKTIHINSVNGAVGTSCIALTNSANANFGIVHLLLNHINKISGNAIEGYKDFTCTDSTSLMDSSHYAITFQKPNSLNSQYYSVWIDYNNNGIFDYPNEQMQTFYGGSSNFFTGILRIYSTNTVYNTPLRMRIIADNNNFSNPCSFLNYGQAEDYTLIIKINPHKPIASYTFAYNTYCDSVKYTFNDKSAFHATSWLWKFGDGTTSTLQNPIHSYKHNGTFISKLIASNSFGSDSTSQTISITSIVAPPVLSHSGSMLVGSTIQFNIAFGGTLNYTYWSYGDGNSGYIYTNTNSHVYTSPGTYYLSITYYTGSGCYFYLYDTLTIVANTLPPDALFTSSLSNIGCNNVYYSFTDNSTNLPTSWFWNFGDGTTSTFASDNHFYYQNGNYTVKHYATNAYGTDSASKIISVTNLPIKPTISIVGALEINQPIQFNMQYNGSIGFLNWNFGDGFTSSNANPSHTYINASIYVVGLQVYDDIKNCNLYVYDTIGIFNVGVNSVFENPNLIKLYPNPFETATLLSLDLKANNTVSIKVMNMLGQQIINPVSKKEFLKGVHEFSFGDELPAGYYLLQITIGDETKNLKLIKQR